MLVEIRCDKFISHNEPRPPIRFHAGLNTVLGDESGSNSIGKSTSLMIVDFCFGGNDYVLKSTDIQKQIGPHLIQFAFKFDNEMFYFSRDTIDYTRIFRCDENYNPISVLSRDEFCSFLLEKYSIQLPYISFREVVGRHFRIYGRDNLDEKRPLLAAHDQKAKDAIKSLMKLFGSYGVVFDLEVAAKKSADELAAYKRAQEYKFIPRINKGQLKDNEKKIAELHDELIQLQMSSGNELMGLDSQQVERIAEYRRKLTAAKRQKSRLSSQLTAVENDMNFEKQSGKYSVVDDIESPRGRAFQRLQEFFPGVNLRRLADIEVFHEQLVEVLNSEYEEAIVRYKMQIALAEEEIACLEQEIRASGLTPKISSAILEDYAAKKGQIRAIEKENEAYSKLIELKQAADEMEKRLIAMQEEQIGFLQSAINVRMDKINDVIYLEEKKPPVLTIKKPNSYTFLTPDDMGTGTSYKGLVVFDLAVLQLTVLPALIHDSVILKQIADEPLERIIRLYSETPKQVFIALDKKSSYTKATQMMLEKSTVLSLSDGGNELFGRSWNLK
jgi:uncharacterized protein YydD (DUF2326 family)